MPTWGSLPTGDFEDENSDLDESSSESESDNEDNDVDNMEESGGENENEDAAERKGVESIIQPPPSVAPMAADLRKPSSGEDAPAQLYRVLEQKAPAIQQAGVFQTDVQYVVPGKNHASTPSEGAASVLSKTMPPKDKTKRKRNDDDELGKSFKF